MRHLTKQATLGRPIRALDRIDRSLLATLQGDSRYSIAELGEIVGLSTSACHRRVKALEEMGAIKGYRASIDPVVVGYSMAFFVEVVLAKLDRSALEEFERFVMNIPEILECYLVAGQSDYVLRLACRDTEDFERIHRSQLSRLPGVSRISSNMSIRTVKEDNGLPL